MRLQDRGLQLRLGSIPVRISAGFLVSIAIAGLSLFDVGRAVTFVVVAFVSVLVHELGHAVAFRRCGGVNAHVVLHAGGAYAMPSATVSSPLDRIFVYAAGPVTPFVLLGVPALALQRAIHSPSWALATTLTYLVWLNVYFSAFNLLPVAPCDGGQIIRELLEGWFGRAGLAYAQLLSGVVGVVGGGALLWVLIQRVQDGVDAVLGPAIDAATATATATANATGLATTVDVDVTAAMAREAMPPAWFVLTMLAGTLLLYGSKNLTSLARPATGSAAAQLDGAFLALCDGDLDRAEQLAGEALRERTNTLVRGYAVEMLAWVALTRGDEGTARRLFARVPWAMKDRSHLQVALTYPSRDRRVAMTVRRFRAPLALPPAPVHVEALARDGVLGVVGDRLLQPGSTHAASGRLQFMTTLFRAGRFEDAARFGARFLGVSAQRDVVAFNLACCHARLGDVESGLAWLARSYDEFGYGNIDALRDDPDLDALRSDGRFDRLCVRVEAAAPQASRTVATPR